MRVVAILAIRDERPYLANCLHHLVENGIAFAVIDNGSSDRPTDILREPRFASSLVAYQQLPFKGVFDLTEQLLAKQRLSETLDLDWVIHLDADEIMHSYRDSESLREAVERLDTQGWEVINFDEFVFLPVEHDYVINCDGTQPLRHYYFFEPYKPRLMRAWKKRLNLSNVYAGGHVQTGSEFRLAPETFALRHYIFRNEEHASTKYAQRQFSQSDLARGWHMNRIGQPITRFAFPGTDALECLVSPENRNLSRAKPHKKHYWQW